MISQNQRNKVLIITVLFVFLSMGLWTSSWFEINGRGTYIEGIEREPSIVVEYTIDSSQESISVSLENATPLLQYWRNREIISNQEMTDEDQQETNVENSLTEEESSTLDVIRTLITIIIFFIGLSIVESVRKSSRIWNRVSIVVWFILGLSILFQVPMSAIDDFGLSQDGESSTGGFDSASNDEVSIDQFAHHSSNSGIDLEFFNLNFYYSSQGYDLGLLSEEDRQQVIDNPPIIGEKGYESFIKFDAEMKAGPGTVIYWWLSIGILIFYWNRSLKTDSSDGNLDS